jgi:hypothetical protein
MALTELWKTAHKEIQDKHVQQVIGFAGDGKLRDGGAASKEFRDFLALVPSSFLSQYANDCLTDKFDNSGLALQDVINEVGTRLGFRVEQGRYRGTQGEIGFDGLWISPDEKTEREDRFYWHVRIHKDKEGYLLRVKKGADTVRLNEYLLKG